jgi:hypothetical protein
VLTRRVTAHIDSTPHFDGSITASSVDDVLSSPSNDVDTGRVTSQNELELSCRGVPYSDGSVFRGGSESGGVGLGSDEVERLKGKRRDPFGMSGQLLTQRLAGLRIPQTDLKGEIMKPGSGGKDSLVHRVHL